MGKKKIQTLVFDEDSRREFVTGFHKRKLERKKKAAEEFERKLKEAKKQIKEKIREAYKKVIRPVSRIENDLENVKEIEYELPEHTVKVIELQPDEIAEQHNWIGRNRLNTHFENEENQKNEYDEKLEADNEDMISGMSFTSIKQVRRIVTNQAGKLMQNNKVFKKKNRIEASKSRKKAALRRHLLKKEQKKLKGRKRK